MTTTIVEEENISVTNIMVVSETISSSLSQVYSDQHSTLITSNHAHTIENTYDSSLTSYVDIDVTTVSTMISTLYEKQTTYLNSNLLFDTSTSFQDETTTNKQSSLEKNIVSTISNLITENITPENISTMCLTTKNPTVYATQSMNQAITNTIASVSIILSIFSLTIKTKDTTISVDVTMRLTCKNDFNITLMFKPVDTKYDNFTRKCYFIKNQKQATCDNLTYGLLHNIEGFMYCGRNLTKLTNDNKQQLYVPIKPKYLGSFSTTSTINSTFLLPGIFNNFIIQIQSVNHTCNIIYDQHGRQNGLYNCLFTNLSPAQWYVIAYHCYRNDHISMGDLVMSYTDLEDLNLNCHVNHTINFVRIQWTKLLGDYTNLSVIVREMNNTNKQFIYTCDIHQQYCDVNSLNYGQQYEIIASIKKFLPNYDKQKNETCTIKTDLPSVSISSIKHEKIDDFSYKITWSIPPLNSFDFIRATLVNIETNQTYYPSQQNELYMVIFDPLETASIYVLKLNISKLDWKSFVQNTNYFIQTDLEQPRIETITRTSSKLRIFLHHFLSTRQVKLKYCLQLMCTMIDVSCVNTANNCTTTDRFEILFEKLLPAMIYNVSIVNTRHVFEMYTWPEIGTWKVINTEVPLKFYSFLSESALEVRSAQESEQSVCSAEINWPLIVQASYINILTSCKYLEIDNYKKSKNSVYQCNDLRCGCLYRAQAVLFTNLTCQWGTNACDFQWNSINETTLFQTPLESISNLRLSIKSKDIEVIFRRPMGCYDELYLICESMNNNREKQEIKITNEFNNPTMTSRCNDLNKNEKYRIYVQTRRNGWDTVSSHVLETNLKREFIYIVIPCVVGFTIVILIIIAAAFIFRRRRSRNNLKQPTTNMNNIVNQVNIYSSSSKQVHPLDAEREMLLSRPIRIKDLPSEYELLTENNNFNTSEEFSKLQLTLNILLSTITPNGTYRISECALLPCNVGKNRYKDIMPYEHSRVKLIPVDDCDTGYINANFISVSGFDRFRRRQGPLKTTVNDQWRMIWEQNVRIIVMLTGLIERGITKCEQYWPEEINKVESYGDIYVYVSACVDVPAYDLRYIQVRKNDDVRTVKHYYFKMWDDHSTPSQTLDRLLQQFDRLPFHGYLDVYSTVLDMRKCRDKMVQNE
ncbi:unnamed protein product, partial [Didymodactylos carnosus]